MIVSCPRCKKRIDARAISLQKCDLCDLFFYVDHKRLTHILKAIIKWKCPKCQSMHEIWNPGLYECKITECRYIESDLLNECIDFQEFQSGCGWLSLVHANSEVLEPPNIIEWECPECDRLQQCPEAGFVVCTGECNFSGTINELGEFNPPLIQWSCPDCGSYNLSQHKGLVQCYQDRYGCNHVHVIDEFGILMEDVIAMRCPECQGDIFWEGEVGQVCYKCQANFQELKQRRYVKNGMLVVCRVCGFHNIFNLVSDIFFTVFQLEQDIDSRYERTFEMNNHCSRCKSDKVTAFLAAQATEL